MATHDQTKATASISPGILRRVRASRAILVRAWLSRAFIRSLPFAGGAAIFVAIVWHFGAGPLDTAPVWGGPSLVAAAFLAIAGGTVARRARQLPTLLAAAIELDQSAKTHSALASSLEFTQGLPGPFEKWAMSNAAREAERSDLAMPTAPRVTGALPRIGIGGGLLVGAIVFVLVIPPRSWSAEAAAGATAAVDPARLSDAQELIESARVEVAQAAEDLGVEADDQFFDSLEAELEDGLRDPDESLAKAAEQLDELAERAETEADRAERTRDDVAERLAELEPEEYDAARDLAEALAAGDFDQAAQEAESLGSTLDDPATRDDLRRLADQLDRAAEPAEKSVEQPEAGPETQPTQPNASKPDPLTQDLRDLAEDLREQADRPVPQPTPSPPPDRNTPANPETKEQTPPTDESQEPSADEPTPQSAIEPDPTEPDPTNPTEPQQQDQSQPEPSEPQPGDQREPQQDPNEPGGRSDPQPAAEPDPEPGSEQSDQPEPEAPTDQPADQPQQDQPAQDQPAQDQPNPDQPGEPSPDQPGEPGPQPQPDPNAPDEPSQPNPDQPSPPGPGQPDPNAPPRPSPGEPDQPSPDGPVTQPPGETPGDNPGGPGPTQPNGSADPSGDPDAKPTTLERLAQEQRRADDLRRFADDLRDRADQMLSDDPGGERAPVSPLNDQSGIEPPAQNADPWSAPTELIDARDRDADSESRERVISEWFKDPEGRPLDAAAPAEARDTIRRAARDAERAVEQQTVPRRYEDLVRRVFERYARRTEPASDASDAADAGAEE